MWTYVQRTGKLYRNGVFVTTGYSGHGKGVNNPEMQNVSRVGPIPVDHYTIGRSYTHKKLGKWTFNLTPNDGRAGDGDRDLFRIHGDSHSMDKTASLGCIILDRPTRWQIEAAVLASDDQLEVIAEERMRA